MRREKTEGGGAGGGGGGLIPVTRAASWANGAVPYYQLAPGMGQTSFASAVVIDRLILVPFRMGIACGIDQLAIVITIAAGAGGVFRIGLYQFNNPASTGWQLLWDSGSQAADGAIGEKIINVSPVVRLDPLVLYGAVYLAGTSAPTILCMDDARGTNAQQNLGVPAGSMGTGTKPDQAFANFSFSPLPATVSPSNLSFNGTPEFHGRFTP